MSRRSDPLDELMAAVEALAGRQPEAEDRGRFQLYVDLILRWNRTHRMTAVGSPQAIVRDLLIDSLLFLPLLPPRPVNLVDIGAGAGIPGLPLGLADHGIAVTLIESRRKRVSFLRTVRRELGMEGVVVLEGRAEELVDETADLRGTFDAVVARAVASAGALLPTALKYLKTGGVLVVSGSPDPSPQPGLEIIRVPIPGASSGRAFLKAVKEG